MKFLVYDIEVLSNVFTFVGRPYNSEKYYTFEISPRKNDAIKLREFIFKLQRNNYHMVGWNSYHYDYPVLHDLLNNIVQYKDQPAILCKLTKAKSDKVFEDSKDRPLGPYKNVVWDNQVIVPQIDLYKIHHFDREGINVSLKN